jgi:hypothetical protein
MAYEIVSDDHLALIKRVEDLEHTLKILLIRMDIIPCVYKDYEQDGKPYWWVTEFSYEQLKGNWLECLSLVQKALEKQ